MPSKFNFKVVAWCQVPFTMQKSNRSGDFFGLEGHTDVYKRQINDYHYFSLVNSLFTDIFFYGFLLIV